TANGRLSLALHAPGTPCGAPSPTPCSLPFSDVQPTDYFHEAVGYLYCRGVISGYADGTFRPYSNTTRGQLCKIVVLAHGWSIYLPPAPTFRDVPATDPFYGYIETAYNSGIISGYFCGLNCLEFRPGNNITRGQLCKIMVLAQGWPSYYPPTPTFVDVALGDPFYTYIEAAYHQAIISGYSCGEGCLEFRPGNSATRGQICKIAYLAVSSRR
ncbi:MAG: S-layer homology domain-containing protein, partial [Chloroflexia bacterium]